MTERSGANGALPSSGGWKEGQDEVGERKFVDLVEPLVLERGGVLPNVRVAYETWGALNEQRDNAILVEHALTGDSHVVGQAGPGHPAEGWWNELVGPGLALDTDEYFIVATNVLGGCQGTTGPSSLADDGTPWGSRFPQITVRDQVNTEAQFAARIGIESWHSVVGGSMGGMRVLEWAVAYPERVRSIAVLASSAYATAGQIATQSAQVEAIRNDPYFHRGDYYKAGDGFGPTRGLGIARKFAFLTYRNEYEIEQRFGRTLQGESELLAVQSYFQHQAEKLARRFDANTYIALNEAMNSWTVGRIEFGDDWRAALQSITVPAVVVGVDSDNLYPIRLQQELALHLPTCEGGLRTVKSEFGHDGFLLEAEQLEEPLRAALAAATRP